MALFKGKNVHVHSVTIHTETQKCENDSDINWQDSVVIGSLDQ